jgi:hypothetical protein
MPDSLKLLDRPPAYWMAECNVCGKSYAADRDDVLRFLRGPWPVCCGQAMMYCVVDGDPPLAEPAD